MLLYRGSRNGLGGRGTRRGECCYIGRRTGREYEAWSAGDGRCDGRRRDGRRWGVVGREMGCSGRPQIVHLCQMPYFGASVLKIGREMLKKEARCV